MFCWKKKLTTDREQCHCQQTKRKILSLKKKIEDMTLFWSMYESVNLNMATQFNVKSNLKHNHI